MHLPLANTASSFSPFPSGYAPYCEVYLVSPHPILEKLVLGYHVAPANPIHVQVPGRLRSLCHVLLICLWPGGFYLYCTVSSVYTSGNSGAGAYEDDIQNYAVNHCYCYSLLNSVLGLFTTTRLDSNHYSLDPDCRLQEVHQKTKNGKEFPTGIPRVV